MNTMISKNIGIGVLVLLVFLSGFWLARSGKPYSPVIFTVHKLIALGAVILLGMLVSSIHRTAPLQAAHWLAVTCTALCLLALFITGGLLSIEKAIPGFVLKIHRMLPYLAVIAIAVSSYLLIVKRNLLVVD
jgi:hypothetical protein